MLKTPFSRVLVALAISLLFVGSTVAQPTDLASGYAASVAYDVANLLADDSFSSDDLIPTPQTTGFIALAALLILVGFRPRPAVKSYLVSYPILPQGPPTRY